ncbi:MAG: SDR family oxidoreductase [Pseudomonadota bacterium]
MQLPKTPSFRLDGRKALVTGASSGIGLGCAVAMAEAGAHTVLAARRRPELDTAVEAIREMGGTAEAVVLDVADLEAADAAVSQHGPFDILVNSAGVAKHTPTTETRPEEFDLVSDLNFKGAYFLTQKVAKGLMEAGKPGSLINISSQMGHVGGQERAVYCGTKHAVEGFTKAMSIEFGPHGIRVNTVGPTFIKTPLTEPTFARPELKAWVEEKIKLGRIGEVEDIMGVVTFLASDAAALITGTHIIVDGGWTAD